jgi:hypothetical protein
MKLRWWVVGIVAVAAGSMLIIKHLVDTKKTVLSIADSTHEKNFSRYSHEILDSDFDEIDYLA